MKSHQPKRREALRFPALRPPGGAGLVGQASVPADILWRDGARVRLRPGIHAQLIDYKNRVIKLLVLLSWTGRRLIMDLQLDNKLALVTGSTAGIGFAIAKSLAAEGAAVIINGRTETRVRAAMASIRSAHSQARLEPLAADLATAAGAEQTIRQFPAVDILVNSLGMYEHRPFEETGDEDWRAIIEINFMSGVRLSRHYLPRMKAANWGRIIFLSSESGLNIPPEMIHYGVTKTMVLALSRGLAETTAGTGVTVNAVLPGPTLSEGVGQLLADQAKAKGISMAEMKKEFIRTFRPTSLLQRLAEPDEVANLVTYIASPRSSATNGAGLRVDGGVVRSII
jgi:NAD(P)-dependent dehydrogenase (short-subunit alcohol dehydrogenase family)